MAALALARFIPDCVVLLRRLVGDPQVPRWRKPALLALVAYLATPIDLVPDFIPVAGQLDDVVSRRSPFLRFAPEARSS